jgi:Transglutaminase-like superfamily
VSAAALPVATGRRFRLREKTRLAREVVGLYVRTRRLLRRLSLPEVVAELRGSPPPSPEQDAAAREIALAVARRLERVVRRTLGALPADSACLVRSVVLAALLARRGIFASLVIGVRLEPHLEAHAWLELDGEPLARDGELFQRLLEL